MKSKNIISFLIFILCLTFLGGELFAQKKQKKIRKNRSDIIEVADDYFHNAEYYEAIVHYKKAFEYNPKDAYVQYRMGDCYRHMFNYTDAEGYYSRCLEFGPTWETPHPEYWYGLMLKYNGKYAEAKTQFEQFTKAFKPKAKEDLKYYAQAKIELDACDFALKESAKPIKDYHFQLLPPPVNSKFSDYAPSFYLNDTTIVVTSTRPSGKSEGQKITSMYGDSYSNSYRFEKKGDTWGDEKKDDNFNVINGEHNDGAGCFNKAKDKYYYTNCSATDGTCGIYLTHLKDGKWQKSEPLNEHINKPGTWNGQPSLNETDDTLFFVSKRPGGQGMHDIWYSQCVGRPADHWVEAKNCGPNINTPFSELSPHHYHLEKTLFFSSNGKPGFGGLDIFVAHGDSFQTVVNLGLPFNSSKDDFYFNYGRHKGYLCSNRDNGVGSDDIYMFHIDKGQSVLAYLELDEPVDSTKKPEEPVNLPMAENQSNDVPTIAEPPATTEAQPSNADQPTTENSETVIINSDPTTNSNTNSPTSSTNSSNSRQSNEFVNPNTNTQSNKVVNQSSKEANSNPSNTTKSTAIASNGAIVPVVVVKSAPKKEKATTAATVTTPKKTTTGQKANSISVSGQVVNETDNQPVADVENMLAEENGTVIKKSKTNAKGEFRYENIPADKNYKILIKDEDSNTEKENISNTTNSSTSTKTATASPSTKKRYGVKKVAVTASEKISSKNLFENLYFDFDKAELRAEAKKVLDELAEYWSQHKEVQIEMNAYTDDWGEDEYNQLLAEKRGQMGLDYLIERGVDKSALVLAAQGESNPLAPNMSLIGRQLNRRVEFSIIGGPGYVAKTMTYVLEPKNTLYSIAKKYGMTVDELKELNGLTDESILAWRPLRVKKTDDANASIAPVTLEAMQNAFITHNGDSLLTATNQFSTGYSSELTLTPEEESIYEIYTIVPQNTMYSISREFGMTVEEIKTINNLSSNTLKIGQKLKVKKRN